MNCMYFYNISSMFCRHGQRIVCWSLCSVQSPIRQKVKMSWMSTETKTQSLNISNFISERMRHHSAKLRLAGEKTISFLRCSFQCQSSCLSNKWRTKETWHWEALSLCMFCQPSITTSFNGERTNGFTLWAKKERKVFFLYAFSITIMLQSKYNCGINSVRTTIERIAIGVEPV